MAKKKIYTCAYCGNLTSMPPYTCRKTACHDDGKFFYPSCCDRSKCINKWRSKTFEVFA